MQIDLTVSISVILALSAILSPIIVSIINNHHQLKIKRIEINEKYIISAFQNYLSKLEECISFNVVDYYQEYNKAFGQALLYASPKSKELMKQIDLIIKINKQQDLSAIVNPEMIFELSDSLRNDIRRVKS